MRKLIQIITLMVFIALNINHAKAQNAQIIGPNVEISHQLIAGIEGWTIVNLTTAPKTTYYVKVGNTISKLEDKAGYIIAAKRLGMETIMIISDGKVYRTVSLDLNKDNEALKEAIEVKLDEIIVAN